jgi:DNA-binding CsgD family transcriptional regulator
VFSNLRMPMHPLDELSSRDLEMLRLLAQGRTLPQIADTLGIAYKTAANSSSRIKTKLGASGTADLIRIAIRSGLVDPAAGPSAASPED